MRGRRARYGPAGQVACDGDADHHSPALNSYDWVAIRQAFADIGYAGPWTMEVSRTSRGESLEELVAEISAWLAGWL